MELEQLKGELQKANAEFKKFNAEALKAATGVRTIEESSKKAGKAASTFGGSFRQTLAAIVGGNLLTRVVAGVGQFARNVVGAASTLTELDSKARVVFGETFPQVQRETRKIADEVGRANSAILQFSADMGAVIDAAGMGRKATAEMSTALAKLAVDLASFHNTTDEEAFTALRSAITGELEPLKRFGVVMTQANLQAFALTKGIRQKIETMNQAQQTAVRYAFIMDRTRTAQGDAARTASSFANEARRLAGTVRTLQEELGKDATPILAQGLHLLNGGLTASIDIFRVFIDFTRMARQEWAAFLELLGLGGAVQKVIDGAASYAKWFAQGTKDLLGMASGKAYQIKNYQMEFDENDRALAAQGLSRAEIVRRKQAAGSGDLAAQVKSLGGGASAGGADGLKKTLQEIERTEQEILGAMEEQAKLNRDRADTLKEELELRRKMGTLTDAEGRLLERLNRRSEYQKDNIEAATEAWEEQADKVEEVEKTIADLNAKIEEERRNLRDTLADIDRDTARSKEEKAGDMIRDLKELDDKLVRGEGNSEADQRKRKEIEAALATIDPTLRKSGERISGLNAFEEIDRQAQQKRDDAQKESDAKIAAYQKERAEAEATLQTVRDAENEKIIAVLDAWARKSAEHFALENQKLTDFVNTQVSEYQRLAGSIGAAAVRKATGGPVSGPGGPTDDRVPALLSDGEYVINAAATKMFRPLLDRINFGVMPRFASGGPVTHNDSHNVNVSIANHGDAARLHADPRLIRWSLRKLL